MAEPIHLKNGSLGALVHNGQLVSFSKDGIECMHGGGKPAHLQSESDKKGWNNSEIVMFPVVGKPKGYKVIVNGVEYAQDQHGISRIIPYHVIDRDTGNHSKILLRQEYAGRTLLDNPKYKKGAPNPQKVSWPFSFILDKEIELQNYLASATFALTNKSNKYMPYDIGWHLAVKSSGNPKKVKLKTNKGEYSLDDVINESARVNGIRLEGVNEVIYVDEATGREIHLKSQNFGNILLWSPEANMFCIEPVTKLPPLEAAQNYLFSQGLTPSERKTYRVTIQPFNS